jgi:hypothetical protein
VIAVTGFVFYFIGAGMVWHELIAQTDDSGLYKGTFNAASYTVLLWLFPLLVPFLLLILIKGKWIYNFVFLWLAAFVYVGVGAGCIMTFGHQEPPATGRYDWVSHSAASINAVRIAWEEGGRTCVEHGVESAKQSCLEAKYRYNSFGFERSEELQALGLSNFYMINQVNNTDSEREDVQLGLTGLVILFLVGGTAFVSLGGYSMSKGGYPMVPFAGTTKEETTQVSPDGWTKPFASRTFASMIGLGFALVSAFVLWTSDAAADPTHPFYETVLGMAISTFVVASTIFMGVVMEESIFLEIGLFLLGLTVFHAPVRMWQMTALSETAIVSDSILGRVSYSQDVAAEAEIDRYYIGGALSIISGVIALVVGPKALAATGTDTDESLPPTNHIFELLVMLGTLGSIIGMFTSFGMLLKYSEDILGEIDATNSDRGNAVNYFIFSLLFAFLGFLINTRLVTEKESGRGAEGNVFDALVPYRSLSYVSSGIVVSYFAGFSNIGTHDRQLWMIDLSMGGVNELRSLLSDGAADGSKSGRAYGVNEDQYAAVLGASIIFFVSMVVCFTASLNMPFAYTGKSDASKAFANIRTKTGKVAIIFAVVGAVFWTIGFVSLMSLDLAAAPISHAAGTNGVDVADCAGKTFNMHFLDGSCGDTAVPDPAGERFTLNLLNSGDFTDAATARYTEIFTFSSITLLVLMLNFQGTLGGSLKSVKTSMFISIFGLLGLSFALSWVSAADYDEQVMGVSTADVLCRRGGDDTDDEEECRTFKNGFVFYWLQTICVMISGATSISSSWYENEVYGKKKVVVGEKKASRGFCAACCSCCSSEDVSYTAESTEPADAAEAAEAAPDDSFMAELAFESEPAEKKPSAMTNV